MVVFIYKHYYYISHRKEFGYGLKYRVSVNIHFTVHCTINVYSEKYCSEYCNFLFNDRFCLKFDNERVRIHNKLPTEFYCKQINLHNVFKTRICKFIHIQLMPSITIIWLEINTFFLLWRQYYSRRIIGNLH